MTNDIRRQLYKVLVNSLDTAQINFLGEKIDSRFNIYTESGFHANTPLPRQTAADVLLNRFNTDEEAVELFSILLRNEGERFYNATLQIRGRDDFITLLQRHKWIYDPDVKTFSLDPFYEHEINLLKRIHVIDLRKKINVRAIIDDIVKASSKLSMQDLEWRITIRLYDLNPEAGELTRNIIKLLLMRQNLEVFADEMFFCLKELAINATKANYKILFEKYIARPLGIDQKSDYRAFLQLFKEEIEQNGNRRLLELARKEDKYINLTFQSTEQTIEMWAINSERVSAIEKEEILHRIEGKRFRPEEMLENDNEQYSEGAGFGLRMILSVLRSYTKDKHPLKVIFYPDFVKIGFILQRSELAAKLHARTAQQGGTGR